MDILLKVIEMMGLPEVSVIPLTRGYFAIVDSEDFERVSEFNWHADIQRDNYIRAARNTRIPGEFENSPKRKIQYLHRFIMGNTSGVVDHINGNALDNRKSNLRVVSVSQNIRNRRTTKKKRFKGVSFSAERNKWVAQLMKDRRQVYIGRFNSEIEAALAYDETARREFGEFAALNFPKEGERAAYRE